MSQIADAPWIREAEMYGMPPYDDDPDYTDQIEMLKKADRLLDDAIDELMAVEQDLDCTEFSDDFRDLIHHIEDIGCDIRAEIKELERGCK